MQNPPRKFPNITINITILSLCSLRNRLLGGNMSFSASLRLFCAWKSFEQRPSFYNTMCFFFFYMRVSHPHLTSLRNIVSCRFTAPLLSHDIFVNNENQILVLAKRFLISPRGQHYRLLKGNVWRKIFSRPKKRCGKRSTLFSR